MTIADDYFNTPPENREPVLTAGELMELEERRAEYKAEIAQEIIFHK